MNSINVYKVDANGWAHVRANRVTADNKMKVLGQTGKMALIEMSKAIGNAAMLTLVGVATAAVAFATFKIACVIIGYLVFPTAIIPPLYSLITTTSGLVIGGIGGHVFAKKYGLEFFQQMKEHGKYSLHLLKQANEVRKLRA